MPFTKARELIYMEDRKINPRSSQSFPPTTEIALKNAERIAKIVYEVYLDLDSKDRRISDLRVSHIEEGVFIAFHNEYGIFEFTCFATGRFKFYQYMWGQGDVLFEEEDMEFTDKEIKKRILRKRYPYEKKL